MAKFKFTDGAATPVTYYMDSASFAGLSATGATAITLLGTGSISIAGVNSVTGTSNADTIKLLGVLTAAQATATFGEATAISAAVSAFAFDTKTTSSSLIDKLTGAAATETITLTNSAASGVKVSYSSGSITLADTLIGTVSIDTITLSAASKITYQSASSVAATDIIAGSTGNDNITLTDGVADETTTPVNAVWTLKSGGGNDTVTGDNGIDVITLNGASAFTYNTGGGADSITGSSGGDSIKLGTGATTFSYTLTGGGTDTITGSTAADTITIGGGTSTTTAVNLAYSSTGTATDTIELANTGSAATDTVTLVTASKVNITSVNGADTYNGSASADTITSTATAGSTIISGKGGADILTGTAAAIVDTFAYGLKTESGTTSTTRDTIINFNAGAAGTTVDILKFAGMLKGTFSLIAGDRATSTTATNVANFTAGGNSEARFYDTGSYAYKDAAGVSKTDTGGLLEVDADGNGSADMTILLVGVAQSTLAAGDFAWSW
ncbi:MAG: hypothetical protein Q8N96_06855 [Methylovulum sp.]|nr:hypothetical protein [Methylovulum sp.]